MGHMTIISLNSGIYFQIILLLLAVWQGISWRMTNSAEPNQTAPKEQSDLGLHCLLSIFCPNVNKNYDTEKLFSYYEMKNNNLNKLQHLQDKFQDRESI